MKKMYSLLGILFFAVNVLAQNVGIGNTDPKVSLDVQGAIATRGSSISPAGNAINIPANVSLVSVDGGSATDTITCFFPSAYINGQRLIIYNNNATVYPLRFMGSIIPKSQIREFIYGSSGGWKLLSGALEDQPGSIWTKYQDSIAVTNKKYVGINTDYNLYPPNQGIQANGSLLMHEEMVYTNALPTGAQTYTMNNLATTVTYSDSIVRIFDPGGSNIPYSNNNQGNIRLSIIPPGETTWINDGYIVSFNPSDFGIGAGDTLWMSETNFPFCRTNYIRRFTNTSQVPADFTIGAGTYIIFRSNADNLNSNGFDITCKALFSKNITESGISPLGKSLFFNAARGSLSVGYNTLATGSYSFATGIGTTASGYISTALGSSTAASGVVSTAMGNRTIARGDFSTAMGNGTRANGDLSTAMGLNTTASGNYSTALGSATTARAYISTAIGAFNDSIATSSPTLWVNTDPLFYIGNGQSSSTRSNAMVVYKNANVDINGYTRLGKENEAAPKIRMKKMTVYCPASQGTLSVAYPHGLTASKILSITGLLTVGPYQIIPNHEQAGYKYTINEDSGNIYVTSITANSFNILNAPIKILITYEE